MKNDFKENAAVFTWVSYQFHFQPAAKPQTQQWCLMPVVFIFECVVCFWRFRFDFAAHLEAGGLGKGAAHPFPSLCTVLYCTVVYSTYCTVTLRDFFTREQTAAL